MTEWMDNKNGMRSQNLEKEWEDENESDMLLTGLFWAIVGFGTWSLRNGQNWNNDKSYAWISCQIWEVEDKNPPSTENLIPIPQIMQIHSKCQPWARSSPDFECRRHQVTLRCGKEKKGWNWEGMRMDETWQISGGHKPANCEVKNLNLWNESEQVDCKREVQNGDDKQDGCYSTMKPHNQSRGIRLPWNQRILLRGIPHCEEQN